MASPRSAHYLTHFSTVKALRQSWGATSFVDLVATLAKQGSATVEKTRCILVEHAARGGTCDDLQALADHGYDLAQDCRPPHGWGALHIAAWHGRVLATRHLLATGLTADRTLVPGGPTPMDLALAAAETGVLNALLKHDGRLPQDALRGALKVPWGEHVQLRHRYRSNRNKALAFVLAQRPFANAQLNEALLDAAQLGWDASFFLLLDHGADPATPNPAGLSAAWLLLCNVSPGKASFTAKRLLQQPLGPAALFAGNAAAIGRPALLAARGPQARAVHIQPLDEALAGGQARWWEATWARQRSRGPGPRL